MPPPEGFLGLPLREVVFLGLGPPIPEPILPPIAPGDIPKAIMLPPVVF
jgi:hypothetical protein